MNNKIAGYFSQRKIYIKLIAGFIFLSTAIIVILSILFRSIYNDSIYEEVTSSYLSNLDSTAEEIKKLNEEIDFVYISIVSNPLVSNYMDEDIWNPLDEYNIKKEFLRFKNIHSKVYSMYLYNGKINYFITTDSEGKNYSDFPDKGVIKAGKKRKIIVGREIPESTGNGKQKKVISYIYPNFSSDGVNVDSSVIINIFDFSELNMLGENDENENTMLVDDSNHLISTGTLKSSKKNVLDDKNFHMIASSGQRAACFRAVSNNKEYVITYSKIEKLGWYLINVRDYNSITGLIKERTNKVLYIAFIMLLLSGVFIIFLSKNIYSPIDLFIRKLNKSDYLYNRKNRKNELDYIMESFTEAMDKMRYIKENNEKNEKEMKENFLKQILMGILDEKYIQEKLDEYRFEIEFNELNAIVVKIDEFYRIKNDQRRLYEITICKIIHDKSKGKITLETINMFDGTIAIIINTVPDSRSQDFKEILFEIKGTVYKTLGRSITIGIGCEVETLREIKRSYELALEMANNRFVIGYGQIIDETLVKNMLENCSHFPSEIEETLLESIRLGNKEVYLKVIDDLLESLKKYEYNSSSLLLLQIMLVCFHTVNSVMGEEADYYINLRHYNRKLNELEIISQAKEWLIEFYDKYQKTMEMLNLQKNSNKLNKIVNETKSYIRENYSDINLTIDLLAEKFGYTSNYFAKLFKDSTGVYINDYIRKIKIDRAKVLLKESNLSVNEVAELIGYVNKNYFFYAFKKETGLTPLSYRNSVVV